jgi:hypothetical protein
MALFASAAIHGDCHCAVAAVLPSIAPPPLTAIGIVPPLLLSPIVTPLVAHRCHRRPSRSRCHPTDHCAFAAIAYHNCAAIAQPSITSWHTAAPQHAGWLSHWTGCLCVTSTLMGLLCPTSSRPWISALRPHLSLRPSSLVPSSHEWRQRWHQRQLSWRRQMRCIMARPPPCRMILVQGRARAMRARMAVVNVGGVGKVTIIATAINRRHSQQRRHRRRRLNPTAAAVDNDHYHRRQQLPSPLPHSRRRSLPEASGCCLSSTAEMTVILDGSGG